MFGLTTQLVCFFFANVDSHFKTQTIICFSFFFLCRWTREHILYCGGHGAVVVSVVSLQEEGSGFEPAGQLSAFSLEFAFLRAMQVRLTAKSCPYMGM